MTRLKSTFSATALGMFSSGWVWFVADTGGELGVLPTFGPSTLLIRSRENMNYVNGRVLGEDDVEDFLSRLPRSSISPFSKTPPPHMPSSPSHGIPPRYRSFHSNADYDYVKTNDFTKTMSAGDISVARLQKVGDIIYPLFCVPVYEHAWMSAGFGIWGKEDWLKEFWTVLDWEKVSTAFDHALKAKVSLG
jgi:Fe-Mn family superoxide dismutase